MSTVKHALGSSWIALAVIVAFATSFLPERAQAEPVTVTTGVIVGSTIGAGLPAGLSGLGAGTGAYTYVFVTGGAVSVGAAVIAGVAIVGAVAVGGYFLYKYIQKKRAESALAAVAPGNNTRRDAITIPTRTDDIPNRPSRIGGAAGAGMAGGLNR